jgi:hypothetical protein
MVHSCKMLVKPIAVVKSVAADPADKLGRQAATSDWRLIYFCNIVFQWRDQRIVFIGSLQVCRRVASNMSFTALCLHVCVSLSSCLSWHSCHAVFSCLDLPCKTKNSPICNKIIFKFPAGFAGSRAHVNRHSSSRLLCERSLRTSSDTSQVLPCLVPFSHAVIRSNDFHAVLWLKKINRQADFRIAWAFGLLAGCSGLFLIL